MSAPRTWLTIKVATEYDDDGEPISTHVSGRWREGDKMRDRVLVMTAGMRDAALLDLVCQTIVQCYDDLKEHRLTTEVSE